MQELSHSYEKIINKLKSEKEENENKYLIDLKQDYQIIIDNLENEKDELK